ERGEVVGGTGVARRGHLAARVRGPLLDRRLLVGSVAHRGNLSLGACRTSSGTARSAKAAAAKTARAKAAPTTSPTGASRPAAAPAPPATSTRASLPTGG